MKHGHFWLLLLAFLPPVAAADPLIEISARRSLYDPGRRIANLEGEVQIRQGETRIRADGGSFDLGTGQSLLSGNVLLEEPGRQIASENLVADHRRRLWRFSGPATYRSLGAMPLEIRAGRLFYDTPRARADLASGVQLTWQGLVIEAQSGVLSGTTLLMGGDGLLLAPEQVQVWFAASELDLKLVQMRFWGGMSANWPERFVRAERGSYLPRERRWRFDANQLPVVMQQEGSVAFADQALFEPTQRGWIYIGRQPEPIAVADFGHD